jgi:predicted metal-binding membrane protein
MAMGDSGSEGETPEVDPELADAFRDHMSVYPQESGGEMAAMGMEGMNMRLGVEIDSTSGALWAFVPVWTAMMAAMMFPSAQPMLLTFGRVQQQRQARGALFISTWIFAAGYLLVWVAFGVLALLANIGLERLADDHQWARDSARWAGGSLLLLAAAYQVTPLKAYCLNHCRSPLHFVMHRWREGRLGALTMGADHGLYCLGCCWGLMAVLFVVGVMSLPWTLALAVLVYLEKATPLGKWASYLSAVLLLTLSVLVFIDPGSVPA